MASCEYPELPAENESNAIKIRGVLHAPVVSLAAPDVKLKDRSVLGPTLDGNE
jgi:hypothetical protein